MQPPSLSPACPPLFQSRSKISFADFKDCIDQIAKDKRLAPEELRDSIVTSGGPMVNSACLA